MSNHANLASLIDLSNFKAMVDQAYDQIIITDPQAKILYVNDAFESNTGYSVAEAMGKNPAQLWGGLMHNDFYKKMWKVLKKDKKPFKGEVVNKRKDGTKYEAELRITPIKDEKKNITAFIGMERDITHQKEVDRMKTEFVSLVTHQLRTPLTAIKWYASLIGEDVENLSQEQQEMIAKLYKSNESMIELVNTLLNISRIESGKLSVNPKPIKLAEFIKDITDDFTHTLNKKEQKLEVEIDPNIDEITADPNLIREVYRNLISNASKYSPVKSVIKLTISIEDGQLVSRVQDQGVGIPKEDRDKIFSRFYRASNVQGSNFKGSGLGLYLTKTVVENSRGKIWFESKTGKGTTFIFSLPIK